jgi:PAS domain S-box-containing protein
LVNDHFILTFNVQTSLGKRIDELISSIDKKRFLQNIHHVYQTGESDSESEWSVQRPGGLSEICLNMVIQAMRNGDDQIEGILLFAIDVTDQVKARKATEAHLQKVLESLPQISWTASPNGTITFLNRQFYQYTGLSESSALNQGLPSFVDASQLVDIAREWLASIRQQKDFQQQVLLTGKQKVSRWFLAKSTSIRDDKGEIVLWIVACTDIHDQKLFTDALKNKVALRTNELVQANAELKQSNADLQQYASIASHDLQEPLRKIITFASLLKRKYGDVIPGEALEYLTKIGHSSDRMSQLIHELLE